MDEGTIRPLDEVVRQAAREHCFVVYEMFNGNASRAARAVGIHRNQFGKLIKEYKDARAKNTHRG